MSYAPIDKMLSKNRVVVLDGATGTEIYKRGVKRDPVLPWGINGLVHRPEVVRGIHYDYFMSGANVVTTNCFYTTRYALENIESRKDVISQMAKSLTYLAVLLCKDAQMMAQRDGTKQPTCVAGNVAPLEPDNPYDKTTVPQDSVALSEHSEKISNLIEAGVELILIETMTTLYEGKCALEAYDKVGKRKPFWISFSCDATGKLYGGETMREVVDMVESYSPKVLLVNCTPIEGITKALEKLRKMTSITLGAYANVEKPVYDQAKAWIRRPEITPKEYAKLCLEWWKLGARVLGGCCGTTPEDIHEISQLFRDRI